MNKLYAFVENNEIQRINIQLPTTINGVFIPSGATEVAEFGLLEIVGDEPQYDRETQRLTGPSYTVAGSVVKRVYSITDIPAEELAAQALAAAKAARQAEVEAITVTTQSGRVFDGNEDAQNRMSRAVNAMDDADVLPWVLADNSIAQVTHSELREALKLAGAAMAEIWVRPYL